MKKLGAMVGIMALLCGCGNWLPQYEGVHVACNNFRMAVLDPDGPAVSDVDDIRAYGQDTAEPIPNNAKMPGPTAEELTAHPLNVMLVDGHPTAICDHLEGHPFRGVLFFAPDP